MPAENSACSITRDWALERYSTAISLREAPSAIRFLDSSMIHWASARSELASYTRTGSPWPASVRRFLPKRLLLLAISILAESRMWPCER